MKFRKEYLAAAVALLVLSFPVMALAHCDTLDGPVVKAARLALESGQMTPVLKWIRPEVEPEVKAAFERTLKVRGLNPEAKELADMYFFETLVRVHRAGEGAPYTGLKPAGAVDPAILEADKALEAGSVDGLVSLMTDEVADGIKARFHRAHETLEKAETSVDAGREFVEAYIAYTHYIEGLRAARSAGHAEHSEAPAEHQEHGHAEP